MPVTCAPRAANSAAYLPYANLERPDIRAYAGEGANAFLADFQTGG